MERLSISFPPLQRLENSFFISEDRHLPNYQEPRPKAPFLFKNSSKSSIGAMRNATPSISSGWTAVNCFTAATVAITWTERVSAEMLLKEKARAPPHHHDPAPSGRGSAPAEILTQFLHVRREAIDPQAMDHKTRDKESPQDPPPVKHPTSGYGCHKKFLSRKPLPFEGGENVSWSSLLLKNHLPGINRPERHSLAFQRTFIGQVASKIY